jgi:hypothetical protein
MFSNKWFLFFEFIFLINICFGYEIKNIKKEKKLKCVYQFSINPNDKQILKLYEDFNYEFLNFKLINKKKKAYREIGKFGIKNNKIKLFPRKKCRFFNHPLSFRVKENEGIKSIDYNLFKKFPTNFYKLDTSLVYLNKSYTDAVFGTVYNDFYLLNKFSVGLIITENINDSNLIIKSKKVDSDTSEKSIQTKQINNINYSKTVEHLKSKSFIKNIKHADARYDSIIYDKFNYDLFNDLLIEEVNLQRSYIGIKTFGKCEISKKSSEYQAEYMNYFSIPCHYNDNIFRGILLRNPEDRVNHFNVKKKPNIFYSDEVCFRSISDVRFRKGYLSTYEGYAKYVISRYFSSASHKAALLSDFPTIPIKKRTIGFSTSVSKIQNKIIVYVAGVIVDEF